MHIGEAMLRTGWGETLAVSMPGAAVGSQSEGSHQGWQISCNDQDSPVQPHPTAKGAGRQGRGCSEAAGLKGN